MPDYIVDSLKNEKALAQRKGSKVSTKRLSKPTTLIKPKSEEKTKKKLVKEDERSSGSSFGIESLKSSNKQASKELSSRSSGESPPRSSKLSTNGKPFLTSKALFDNPLTSKAHGVVSTCSPNEDSLNESSKKIDALENLPITKEKRIVQFGPLTSLKRGIFEEPKIATK